MVDAATLVSAGKLDPAAIDAAQVDAPAVVEALAKATTPEQRAALAILVGKARAQPARATLVPLLAQDGVVGRAAAWALAQLGAEAELLAAATAGKLDERENGYWGLMVLAARGAASAQLAPTLAKQVEVEIEKARTGSTGLGEHTCRVLAILGAPGVADLIQKVIENDRYCDRFELQRLRKAVQDGGRDVDSVRELGGAWTTVFADRIVVPAAAPAPAASASTKLSPAGQPPTAKPAPGAAKHPQQSALAPPKQAMKLPPPAAEDDADVDAEGVAAEPGAPAIVPIDWKAFLDSAEAKALPPQVKALVAQLGPVLEQLAVRAIQAPLTDLTGQELAALLLQVLPQALPPQAVQAALSPQALNGYQALAKYLARTGVATNGDELVSGVKLVRQELTAQMRQSGILGGPDYSDPDEAKKPT